MEIGRRLRGSEAPGLRQTSGDDIEVTLVSRVERGRALGPSECDRWFAVDVVETVHPAIPRLEHDLAGAYGDRRNGQRHDITSPVFLPKYVFELTDGDAPGSAIRRGIHGCVEVEKGDPAAVPPRRLASEHDGVGDSNWS